MTDLVIPVKRLSEAKSRLSGILTSGERAGLALAMLQDMLGSLRLCNSGNIWLVAADDAVFDVGAQYGVLPIRDSVSSGYNRAVKMGLEAVARHQPVSILPADLPMALPRDLMCLIDQQETGPSTIRIVPDRRERGTNGLFLSTPDKISPVFGESSFFNHRVAAAAVGVSAEELRLPSLAHDIDDEGDFFTLLHACKTGATARFLETVTLGQMSLNEPKWGIV